jgi:hypothetical protein
MERRRVSVGPPLVASFISIENEMGGQAIDQSKCISQVFGDRLRADGEAMIFHGRI